MTNYTITEGNVYITNGTHNEAANTISTAGNQVCFVARLVKPTYNMNKPVIQITPIISPSETTKDPSTILYDLKRIGEGITIDCYVVDDDTTIYTSPTGLNAREKLIMLKHLAGKGYYPIGSSTVIDLKNDGYPKIIWGLYNATQQLNIQEKYIGTITKITADNIVNTVPVTVKDGATVISGRLRKIKLSITFAIGNWKQV
jgi:hypothetical protein